MSAATASVQPSATGTYRIDPSTSTIAFTTRHLFGTAAVKGSFDLSAGEITVAELVTASEVAPTAAAGFQHRWQRAAGRRTPPRATPASRRRQRSRHHPHRQC
jgi:hypothetical protein